MKSGETRFIVKKLDTKKPYTSVGFRLSNGKTTIKKSTITKSRDPYNEANAEIKWNTSGGLVPTEGGMLRNGVTSLAHELCHSYDYMNNTYSTEPASGGYGDIMICDWKAVYHENQVRQELGLPLRTHYNKNKAETAGTGSKVLHGKTPFFRLLYCIAGQAKVKGSRGTKT